MQIHAIILTKANTAVANRIAERFPEHLPLNGQCFLVRSKDISDKIAHEVGIKGEERIEDAFGVVFKLSETYAGYASRSLWEWLTTEE